MTDDTNSIHRSEEVMGNATHLMLPFDLLTKAFANYSIDAPCMRNCFKVVFIPLQSTDDN